jgi:hypothetical protein
VGNRSNQQRAPDLRHGSRGIKPDGIKAHFEAKYPDKKEIVDRMTDAAVAAYCPQY